jgi:hypothetical protein
LKIFGKNSDKCNTAAGFFTANRCMLFRHRHNILLKSPIHWKQPAEEVFGI